MKPPSRKNWIEFFALVSMGFASVGAIEHSPWEWWPFAVMASMFFLAANFETLRSFNIGPSGISAETRDVPESTPPYFEETWKERERLELYVLANLSAGLEPHRLPVNRDPALSRLRALKDAATAGSLRYDGETANAYATVRLDDFVAFAQASKIEDFIKLASQWSATHKDKEKTIERARIEDVGMRLARLRTSGVNLRNRELSYRDDGVNAWIAEFHDWSQTVETEIKRISAADAEWFRTLDAVPPPRVASNNPLYDIDPDYTKAYRELDFMLAKLNLLLEKKYLFRNVIS